MWRRKQPPRAASRCYFLREYRKTANHSEVSRYYSEASIIRPPTHSFKYMYYGIEPSIPKISFKSITDYISIIFFPYICIM